MISHQHLIYRQDKGWRSEQERHALSVWAIHWFDGFRWVLNDEAVAVTCNRFSSPAVECVGETDALVQVTFASGAACTLFESFSVPMKRPTETLIVGESGTLRLTDAGAELYRKDRVGEPLETWENPLAGGSMMAEAVFRGLDNLLTWVDGGPEAPNSGEDNLRSVALLDAAYRSADSGEPVILTAGLPR